MPEIQTPKYYYAASLDGDGCLYHSRLLDAYEFLTDHQIILQENKPLLDHLFQQMQNYPNSQELLIGSARQSFFLDNYNSTERKTLLISDMIRHLGNALSTRFSTIVLNTYLLSDTYERVFHGSNFARAIAPDRKTRTDHNNTRCHVDPFKITLLYAQMHHVVVQKIRTGAAKDDEFIFEFFDDREDILQTLAVFFETYPRAIPPNLTLRLYQYAGEYPELLNTFKGRSSNILDYNYEQTILFMPDFKLEEAQSFESTFEGIFRARIPTPKTVVKNPFPLYIEFPTEVLINHPDFTQTEVIPAVAWFDNAITDFEAFIKEQPDSVLIQSAKKLKEAIVNTKNGTVNITDGEHIFLRDLLAATTQCVRTHAINPAPFFTQIQTLTTEPVFHSMTQKPLGKQVAASLLIFVGIVIIVGSILVALQSAGVATPLSAWGIHLGLSTVATGIASACSIVGAGVSAAGTKMLSQQHPLKAAANNFLKQAPRPEIYSATLSVG